jgi:hypothetical protein
MSPKGACQADECAQQQLVAARRVEWEFWTSSNDGCGNGCDRQSAFKVQMRETAQTLEKVLVPPSSDRCAP